MRIKKTKHREIDVRAYCSQCVVSMEKKGGITNECVGIGFCFIWLSTPFHMNEHRCQLEVLCISDRTDSKTSIPYSWNLVYLYI